MACRTGSNDIGGSSSGFGRNRGPVRTYPETAATAAWPLCRVRQVSRIEAACHKRVNQQGQAHARCVSAMNVPDCNAASSDFDADFDMAASLLMPLAARHACECARSYACSNVHQRQAHSMLRVQAATQR